MKKIVGNILTIFLSLLLLFLAGELVINLSHCIIDRRSPVFDENCRYYPIMMDSDLGWKATENYQKNMVVKDAQGNDYQVSFTSDRRGFKMFGDPNSKNKIFIVGDSFTQALEVSNNHSYYGILANRFKNLDFFVYGVIAYGSLQEFMIIDKFIDKIKPQILILQLCSNDFFNNDYELEARSYENNNGMRRPYLDLQGNIFYKNPDKLQYIPKFFLKYSKLINIINDNLKIILRDINKKRSVEREIEREGAAYPGFRHAAQITKLIMAKIKARAAGVTMLAFSVNDPEPYYATLQEITLEEGFRFIDGIPQAIRAYANHGRVAYAADQAHWNESGHKIAADRIGEFLLQQGLISPATTAISSPP